jgi:cell division protein FtsI (penicillin-binding protein 3)
MTPGTQHSPLQVDTRTKGLRETFTRMLVVKIGILAFFLIIVFKLIDIQVLKAAIYKDLAARQHQSEVTLPAERGIITDRNGHVLVSNTSLMALGADPKMVAEGGSENDIVKRLARAFDRPESVYRSKLGDEEKRFVYLERRANPEVVRRTRPEELKGIVVINEPERLYSYDRVAGALLGFTTIDGRGVSGVELELDSLLRGCDGKVIMQRDGHGRRRSSVDYPRIEPVNGASVELTIDIDVQSIAEEELRRGVEKYKAQSGLVVMLDPATGEVLALATYPTTQPAERSMLIPDDQRIRAITDMYEPGSVFKIVTAAAALDDKLVRPEQKFNAEQGMYRILLPNGKLRQEITDTHKHGLITFQEAMEVSSNIVMAKVSDIVGAERLYTRARSFGFGTETGIGLPGEVRGELKRPSGWSGTTLNTMAYGYEVGVTPLQIAAAYGAVANRGGLMKPFIVRRVVNANGDVLVETRPQLVRNVVTNQPAETLTKFFRGVVERGTGKEAGVTGFPVAGKTGTSRKFVDGRYVPGSYIASFVGFFPADAPAAVCLVMLDNPRDQSYTGGLVSAPIFKAIAQKVYATSPRFMKKALPIARNERQIMVPDVATLRVEAARAILEARGLRASSEGKGPVVLKQFPASGTRTVAGTTIVLSTQPAIATAPQGFALVPDVRGLPIRRAVNRLAMAQLDVTIAGSGLVVSQSLAGGEQVRTGTRIGLRCEPRPLTNVTLY